MNIDSWSFQIEPYMNIGKDSQPFFLLPVALVEKWSREEMFVYAFDKSTFLLLVAQNLWTSIDFFVYFIEKEKNLKIKFFLGSILVFP